MRMFLTVTTLERQFSFFSVTFAVLLKFENTSSMGNLGA